MRLAWKLDTTLRVDFSDRSSEKEMRRFSRTRPLVERKVIGLWSQLGVPSNVPSQLQRRRAALATIETLARFGSLLIRRSFKGAALPLPPNSSSFASHSAFICRSFQRRRAALATRRHRHRRPSQLQRRRAALATPPRVGAPRVPVAASKAPRCLATPRSCRDLTGPQESRLRGRRAALATLPHSITSFQPASCFVSRLQGCLAAFGDFSERN